MRSLTLLRNRDEPLRILCLGAHADDIEIGCGGTLLTLLRRHRRADVTWVVFSASPPRAREARASAARFLGRAASRRVVVERFRDGYFPQAGGRIKDRFERLKRRARPDVVFTHFRADRHQDHRVISDLTWNTFRDALVLEYEIPKYDGDLGAPNVFVPLTKAVLDEKVRLLMEGFPTQAGKDWFTRDTFQGLARLRGVESRCEHAEAFYGRKLVITSRDDFFLND
jgi:LmbE family N-acetylglucosaminyl deacetylase